MGQELLHPPPTRLTSPFRFVVVVLGVEVGVSLKESIKECGTNEKNCSFDRWDLGFENSPPKGDLFHHVLMERQTFLMHWPLTTTYSMYSTYIRGSSEEQRSQNIEWPFLFQFHFTWTNLFAVVLTESQFLGNDFRTSNRINKMAKPPHQGVIKGGSNVPPLDQTNCSTHYGQWSAVWAHLGTWFHNTLKAQRWSPLMMRSLTTLFRFPNRCCGWTRNGLALSFLGPLNQGR